MASDYPITLLLGGLCVFVLLTFATRGSKLDPKEPPLLPASIPIVGHVVGLMRRKFNYYLDLKNNTAAPIFTLQLPGQKMYIVTKPDLIQAIQKQPQQLSFNPIKARFANVVCGSSKATHEILARNLNEEEGQWGLSYETYAGMRAALTPGPGLDQMNRVMIQNISQSLDRLATTSEPRRLKLASWLRQCITTATTNSVYGPKNPFLNENIAESFWAFEHNLMALVIGIAPSILARGAINGRERVAKAFVDYLNDNSYENASLLTRTRVDLAVKNGVCLEDIARYEVGNCIAILVNTNPAVFWMLFHIFAHPGLLEQLREEIDRVVAVKEHTSGTTRSLDITSLKSSCPLLASTFQEMLRYRSMGTSVREVMADTLLEDQWLLKKGAMVQMPGRVIHADASIWGNNVNLFSPRRFLKGANTWGGRIPKPAAFRAFGGGTTLCPGRHFASNEILAVVAMFIMRYDMVPSFGEWVAPSTRNTNVAAVIMEPDTDIEVDIRKRQSIESDHWAFSLGDSNLIFAVVAEDHPGEK